MQTIKIFSRWNSAKVLFECEVSQGFEDHTALPSPATYQHPTPHLFTTPRPSSS